MKHTIHAFVSIKMWYFFSPYIKMEIEKLYQPNISYRPWNIPFSFCILIKHLIWKNTYKYICHYENKI